MRGKAVLYIEGVGIRRITPAYAGKSFHGKTGNSQTRDHPRVCGEKESDRRYEVT